MAQPAPLSDHAAATRMQAMKDQIIKGARTKAAAIEKDNLELFNKERASLENKEKEKMREEYARRVKSVETSHAIAKSLAINKSRLEKIAKRQEMMNKVAEEVKGKLKGEQAQDKAFITKLITQGLLIFLEDDVKVQCRAADMNLVQDCMKGAAELYARTVKDMGKATKACRLTLDAGQLPADCLGGVVLTCQNGTIVIDNTIDARLQLVMEQDKPAIRQSLFPIYDGGRAPAAPKPAAPTPASAPAAKPAVGSKLKTLTVTNLAAKNLANSDLIGSSDAYVRMTLVNARNQQVGAKQDSKVKNNGGSNPKWDGTFVFNDLENPGQLTLKLRVLDQDSFLALDGRLADELNDDDQLGAGKIALGSLKSGGTQANELVIAGGYFSNSTLSMNLSLA